MIPSYLKWARRGCVRAVIFASASVFAGFPAAAAEPLAVNLSVARVTLGADGQETPAEAADAKPGDRLRYTAVYHNTTDRRLSGVVATVPVPPGTTIEHGSPRPVATMCSLDGIAFQSWASDASQQPPAASVRAVRWAAVDLAPGASFTVTILVQIDAAAAPTPVARSVAPLH